MATEKVERECWERVVLQALSSACKVMVLGIGVQVAQMG